jgi:hypothetical protein
MGVFVVRLRLPDRPGALGAVASRIGAVGGDITSIDIIERIGGQAVDEFFVELPDDAIVGLLRSEIREVDGVHVENIRRLSDTEAAPES